MNQIKTSYRFQQAIEENEVTLTHPRDTYTVKGSVLAVAHSDIRALTLDRILS